MNTSIQTVHSDVTITYNESDNKWELTLRGRDRSYPTLAQAKEFIDKPVPKEKAKPFEKIPAWHFKYSDIPSKIEVTGIAERHHSLGEYVWISERGKRSKESVRFSIFPQTPENDKLAKTILGNAEEISRLKEVNSELRRRLSPLVLPKDE